MYVDLHTGVYVYIPIPLYIQEVHTHVYVISFGTGMQCGQNHIIQLPYMGI